MVDYTFYTETYLGGAISAEEWPELEARAATSSGTISESIP